MLAIADIIDRMTVLAGKILACLILPLMLLVFANAMARYVFGTGHVWLFEAVGYCFAIVAVGLAGWALKEDEHVRVDIFYSIMSRRKKAVIDVLGTLFLLAPFLWLMWDRSLPYVQRSWKMREGSVEMSGIPFVYLLKTCMLAFCVLLGLATVAFLLRRLHVLITGREGDT
ncbi:TRAP transporter small permease subunit [Ruegeria sp. WL0004]|uniref:TRAP transporter small permease protein n=1 Tax=Ruegeria marisflavi TaxID=2984152 RepID=A0ABT2WWL9_9RHOB|nr:TRAP transporter small permease subunit [Ruegeria sp. WL0004]MCU9840287.1 TRAP transporter small permease subunit [Ruegeria sp. WL0004]